MSTGSKLVVIGGSAGSLQPIFKILAALEPSFHIPLLLVLHRTVDPESSLESLLEAKTRLKVCEIEEKEPINDGCLYVCPADYHVLIELDKTFSLDDSEKVNFSRPSLDVVFTSAADVYGPDLTAILLSGANTDGSEGLVQVKARGGITIVQEPEEAQVSYMPEQAIKQMKPDHIFRSEEIGKYLNEVFRS